MGSESIRSLWESRGQMATDAEFHRVVRLQVYLPLGLGIAAVAAALAIVLLTAGGGGAATRGLADVSLIVLLMPLMILGLVALAGMVVIVIGLVKVIGWIPPRSRKAQRVVRRIAHQMDKVAARVTQAVVTSKAICAGARAAIAGLRGRR